MLSAIKRIHINYDLFFDPTLIPQYDASAVLLVSLPPQMMLRLLGSLAPLFGAHDPPLVPPTDGQCFP